MLKKYMDLPQYKMGKTLDKFSMALKTGHFSIRKDFALVFLCGANKSYLDQNSNKSTPSERRSFLKKTIEQYLPHTKVVYAEGVMEELSREDKEKTKNLLDIEHKISQIADSILIVLESNSAFCELGAFSHMNFREKLIVINDAQFRSSKSFINLGPIQAVEECGNKKNVQWYPMSADGIEALDGIGEIIPSVLDLIKNVKKNAAIGHMEFLPQAEKQSALFFLHDLIALCGPIKHSEIIDIYIKLFGEQPFDDVKQLRGVLHASELIATKTIGKETFYHSKGKETFINFGHFESEITASFRRFHLKFNSNRIFS